MRKHKTTGMLFGMVLLLSLGGLTGCGGSDNGNGSLGDISPGDFNIRTVTTPASVTLTRGATQQFSVTVPAGYQSTWQVQKQDGTVVTDGSAGTVTSTGLYTAPNTPGTYIVYFFTDTIKKASYTASATVTVQ